MKKNLPGIIFVIAISVISILLNRFFLGFIETLTIGILLGILTANIFKIPKIFNGGIDYSLKNILKWGIVLLGVKLNFNLVAELGWKILIYIILLITSVILFSVFLGKKFGINKKLSALVGIGSSICGASAIVAMGPVIEAEDEDVAISVTVISLLGAIGVILFSMLSYVVPINDVQYGVWSGTSLQGVAHALAAAGARGDISMETGTIVKMARVALLAPVALVLGFVFKSGENNKKRVKFPMYVLFFIIVGILFSINSKFNFVNTDFGKFNLVDFLKEVSSFFILMAMVAMGLKVDFKKFKSKVLKVFFVTLIIFAVISSIGYFFVLKII